MSFTDTINRNSPVKIKTEICRERRCGLKHIIHVFVKAPSIYMPFFMIHFFSQFNHELMTNTCGNLHS